MKLWDQWRLLPPEEKAKWDVAAPSGKTGAWFYEKHGGTIPKGGQIGEDDEVVSVASNRSGAKIVTVKRTAKKKR